MRRFFGIADAHGLESFIEDYDDMVKDLFLSDAGDEGNTKKINSMQFGMAMRVMANQQRHAVVYRVQVPDKEAEEIQKMMDNGEYLEALETIKELQDMGKLGKVELGTYGTTLRAAEKNWKMIPNPDLDPYHN